MEVGLQWGTVGDGGGVKQASSDTLRGSSRKLLILVPQLGSSGRAGPKGPSTPHCFLGEVLLLELQEMVPPPGIGLCPLQCLNDLGHPSTLRP